MHCLWITRQDPRAADSGDLIYTLGLLRALASTGRVKITVLTHYGSRSSDELPEIHWEIVGSIPEKTPLSLLTKLPSDAHRLGNPTSRSALGHLLAQEKFDRVIIDQAASGRPKTCTITTRSATATMISGRTRGSMMRPMIPALPGKL